jgi:hypothetical protein
MKKTRLASTTMLFAGILAALLVAAPLGVQAGHMDGTGGFRYTIEGEGGSSSVTAAGNSAPNGASTGSGLVLNERRERVERVDLSFSMEFIARYIALLARMHR